MDCSLKKINFASVDMGLVHIVLSQPYNTLAEISVSGTNGNGIPIKVIVAIYGNNNKAAFLNGTGDVYMKTDTSGNLDIVIIPTTSLDYSFGYVEADKKITTAAIINRTNYDLTDYTKIEN